MCSCIFYCLVINVSDVRVAQEQNTPSPKQTLMKYEYMLIKKNDTLNSGTNSDSLVPEC